MDKSIDSNNESKIETKDNIKVPQKKVTTKERKKLPRVYLYFIYFLLFAFIGWLLETAFSFYSLGYFTKRGFLYGPLCPIYGFGALILIMFFSTYKRHNLKRCLPDQAKYKI